MSGLRRAFCVVSQADPSVFLGACACFVLCGHTTKPRAIIIIIMDSWRHVRVIKELSQDANNMTFVLPYQDDTLSNVLNEWLQHKDQKDTLAIAHAACVVHKDSRAQEAPSRIEVRIGVWPKAPLSPAKILYKALDYCLNQFLSLVRQWSIASSPSLLDGLSEAKERLAFRIVQRSRDTTTTTRPLSLEEQHLTFRLSGVPQPFASALRRAIVTDVPTVAISRIVMLENTSNYHDVGLSQNLTMLPITVEAYRALSHLNFAPNCPCQLKMDDFGGEASSKSLDLNKMTREQFETKLAAVKRQICSKCCVAWEFDMSHDDKLMEHRPLLMTSDNFKRLSLHETSAADKKRPIGAAAAAGASTGAASAGAGDSKRRLSADTDEVDRLRMLTEGICMPKRAMFFGKLNYGQRVHMIVIATKQTGEKCARWQASGPVGFRPVPDILLDRQVIQREWTPSQRQQIVKACPKRVFALKRPQSQQAAAERKTKFSSIALYASEHVLDSDGDGVLDIENAGLDCSRCGACTSLTEAWKTPGAIVIRNAPRNEHEFTVRPRNEMRAVDIVMSALMALAGKCSEVMIDMREHILLLGTMGRASRGAGGAQAVAIAESKSS